MPARRRPIDPARRVVLSLENELDRFLSLDEAAQIMSLSVDSIKRHFPDRIMQITPGRYVMRVRHALMKD
jgi:transcriptional regulator GlxA family with amidase domain